MPGTIDYSGFNFDDVCYGTVANADEFFAKVPQQLDDWSGASGDEKQKCLYEATKAIDKLLYRGQKTSVFNLYAAYPDPTAPPSAEAVAEADASQAMQFPRDGATEVPEDVITATYYEAQSILSGMNAGLNMENLTITSDGAGSTRTSFNRDNAHPRHLVNGITSYFAWRFLQPFLTEKSTFGVQHV